MLQAMTVVRTSCRDSHCGTCPATQVGPGQVDEALDDEVGSPCFSLSFLSRAHT